MVHSRVAVIAERDVAKCELGRHTSPHRETDPGPQRGDDSKSRHKAGQRRHAQDRPGRGLRRVRRGRAMAVMVVHRAVIVAVAVGGGRNHPGTLYYNITRVHAVAPGRGLAAAKSEKRETTPPSSLRGNATASNDGARLRT